MSPDVSTLITVLTTVFPGIAIYVPAVLAFVGFVATIMPWVPVPTAATGVWPTIYKGLNWVAQNFRNAKSAKQPGNPTPVVLTPVSTTPVAK